MTFRIGKSAVSPVARALIAAIVLSAMALTYYFFKDRETDLIVVHAVQKGKGWNESLAHGVSSAIEDIGAPVQVHHFFVDSNRLNENGYLQAVLEGGDRQFRRPRFGGIITSDDQAFASLLDGRDRLFKDGTLIFCGLKYYDESQLVVQNLGSGDVEAFNLERTADFVLHLHPEAKKVFVVSDNTEGVQTTRSLLENAAPGLIEVLDFTFWDNLSAAELVERLQAVPPDGIVLLLSFVVDRNEVHFSHREAVTLVTGNTSAPVYCLWDAVIKAGMVDDILTAGYEQGRKAAEAAFRILSGEALERLPAAGDGVEAGVFDYKQIRHLGVRFSDLPRGSIIFSKPYSFYAENKGKIWVVTGSILALSLIIILLAFHIINRRGAEAALKRYLSRLTILHKTDRAILEAESTHRTLEEALGYVRELISCKCVRMEVFDTHRGEAVSIAVDRDGEVRWEEEFLFTLDEIVPGRLAQGEVIRYPDLFALDSPTPYLRSLMDEGIRSLVMVPLSAKRELIGSLNLGAGDPESLDAEKIEIAKEVAASLAVALQNRRLLDEILRNQKELQKMSALIIQAQEAERARISRELHDEMGQALTGISINLAVAEKSLSSEADGRVARSLREARVLADASSDQIRDLSISLRPAMLDDLGLLPTLRWYVNNFNERTGIPVIFKSDNCDVGLPPEMAIVLYRVAQESLTNAARHAKAGHVDLRLKCSGEAVHLVVEDDGVGFNVDLVCDKRSPERCLGLLGMRERVGFLGGTFAVDSTPEAGTRVSVQIPVDAGEKP
mgnify:CR=1 FL=1